jgi:hypothetical protein
MWPFAIGIAWYYRDNRKNYFKPGTFYYSADRIRHILTDRHPSAEPCYYCHGKMADSRPYKLELIKLKDIKLKSGATRFQHNVSYVSESAFVAIPRSHKALMIHSALILIKILTILGCLLFLDISSIIWRIIIGFAAGATVSRIILTLSGTRSNVTYLFGSGLILRIAVWLTVIALVSKFYFNPLDIYTSDSVYSVIVAIIVFDSMIMQLFNLLLGKFSSYPLFRQYPEIKKKFREGYNIYNDIPVISFVYPTLKWIFG